MSPAGSTCSAVGLFTACLLLLGFQACAQDDHIDPASGFRISHYRAVVPDTAPGATRVGTKEVETIYKDGKAAFIDVVPSTGAGFDPDTGEWRLSERHANIPGSKWLPDVGRGAPGAVLESYFMANLASLTGGDKAHPILIYCQADCWMSWNAVKRAATYGYANIYWYPDGIDGWAEWDNPTAPAVPVPVDLSEAKQ